MVGANEADRVHQREALLEKLSPVEGAFFMLVEHLAGLEARLRQPGDPALIVHWGSGGKSPKEVLVAVMKGDTWRLEVPGEESCGYSAFGWRKEYDEWLDNPEVRARYSSWKEYQEAFPSKGSTDIRIYLPWGREALRIFANQGSFKGMEEDWAAAVGNIPYPIEVEDRDEFRYFNKAYRQKYPEAVAPEERP